MPLRLEAAILSRMRSPVTSRSNWAKESSTVCLATAVVLAIVAGLIGTLVQARTARLQRDAAIRERDRANRVTDFMISTFKVSDPAQSNVNNLTAREILDKASKQIDTEMAKDPEAQARMMYVMSEVYDSLGLFSQAQTLLTRALELQRKVLGPDDPQTLTSLSGMAVLLTEEGNYPEAEKLQREAFAARTRVLGPEHPDTIASMARLATIRIRVDFPVAVCVTRTDRGKLQWYLLRNEVTKLYGRFGIHL